jgi:hypothetical protein
VTQNGAAFQYLPIRRRDDAELLGLAMRTWPRAYLSASERCRRDNTEHAVAAAADVSRGGALGRYISCFEPVAGGAGRSAFVDGVLAREPSSLPHLMHMVNEDDRLTVTVAVLKSAKTEAEARGILGRLRAAYREVVLGAWHDPEARVALGTPA